MKNHHQLLKEFGSHFDLDLHFDEAHQCFLAIDDLMISIRDIKDHFILYGMLGEFPANEKPAFWQHLLSLNSTLMENARGALAFEPQTDTIMLMQSLNVRHMTAVQLSNHVSEFAEQLRHLLALLNKETEELTRSSNKNPPDSNTAMPIVNLA